MRSCQHTRSARRSAHQRRGSTIVMSLILIVVLSVAVAGTVSMVSSDRKAVGDLEATTDAYDIARSGYDKFMSDPAGYLPGFFPPATSAGPDSVKFTFANGSAWVMVQRVRPAVSPNLATYLVRSRATRSAYSNSNSPSAQRTFAQYARWQTGSMTANAAWTSLTGLQKNGGSGTISGVDGCGQASPVAGVAVPNTPGYTQNGGSSVPNGTPNILNMGTQAQANAMITVDWAGIVAGTTMTPDITIPGGAWPSFASSSYWPVIYVNQAGTYSLPGDGRGTLIVRNNLTISGSRTWHGIVLVGGTLTANGNNTVAGTVLTGLNVLLGQTVAVSDVGNGTKTYQYNSCHIADAAKRFSGLSPMRNTSVDNWPAY